MKAAPGRSFGVASGVLRTFANVGMVFSFSVAILIAAHSISRGLAFAIFVGSTRLCPQLARGLYDRHPRRLLHLDGDHGVRRACCRRCACGTP